MMLLGRKSMSAPVLNVVLSCVTSNCICSLCLRVRILPFRRSLWMMLLGRKSMSSPVLQEVLLCVMLKCIHSLCLLTVKYA